MEHFCVYFQVYLRPFHRFFMKRIYDSSVLVWIGVKIKPWPAFSRGRGRFEDFLRWVVSTFFACPSTARCQSRTIMDDLNLAFREDAMIGRRRLVCWRCWRAPEHGGVWLIYVFTTGSRWKWKSRSPGIFFQYLMTSGYERKGGKDDNGREGEGLMDYLDNSLWLWSKTCCWTEGGKESFDTPKWRCLMPHQWHQVWSQ